MDWRKFRKLLEDQYDVSKAYMFIGYLPENEGLYEQMHSAGYSVVLKPTFDMTKPQVEAVHNSLSSEHEDKKPVKGNIDAELVLWAMKELSNYDKAIIVSGDGDFYCLVEYLEEKGRLLHVLTPTERYSHLYNRYEDYIVRLDSFRRQLAYHDRRNGLPGSRKPGR